MTLRVLAGGGGVEETDDDFNLVSTLLHGNGTNGAQNSTFLDSSGNNLTITNSNVYQGTFSPFSSPEGRWSVFMDGVNEYVQIDTSAGLGFGTGAYTIEMWVYKHSTGQENIYDGRDGGNTNRLLFYVNGSNKLAVYENGSVTGTSSGDFPLKEWVHIALSRESGGASRFWMNGAYQGGWSSSVNIVQPSNDLYIGRAYNSGSYNSGGFISNVRVVKGTAVYTGTSAITVPTEPLTAITNTTLLTCCSNRARDKSTTDTKVELWPVADGAKVQPFSPFETTSAYDPAVNGGSGWFEGGSGYYLIASHASLFDFGSDDYCIEAWVYPTAAWFADWTLLVDVEGANNYWGWTLYSGSLVGFTHHTNSLDSYSGSTSEMPTRNAWNHVVYQRTSGNANWYLNGKQIYNASRSHSVYDNTGIRIGNSADYNNYYYKGYVSDFRVTKGNNYNPYSNASTITVPTAPLTAGSYTSLLLNFTNGGVIDHSGKVNVNTVSAAAVNTSVKKFGTGSVRYDDSSYLKFEPNVMTPLMNEFTIEGFVYFIDPASNGQGLFQFSTGHLNSQDGKGPALGTYSGSGKWHIYYGMPGDSARTNTVGSAVAAPSQNTWYHFAYVQGSSTDGSEVIKVFIDGTQIGSDITYGGVYTGHNYLTVGGWYSSSYLLDGYIDDFRITRKARYTSNFTAPTKAFPDKG